jgi:hypothetical protein
MRPGTPRHLVACCIVAGALLAPAAAGAATAAVDRACYLGDGSSVVVITGSGFAPDAEVQLQVAGGIVGIAAADAAGNVRTEFPVPAPPESGASKHDRGYELALVAGATRATVAFRTARVVADFSPTSGSPQRLKVRFSAFGFAAGAPVGQSAPTVYVHYVDPRGKLRRTVSLGRASGPCGTIKRTALRKLFPFEPRRGTWTLQVDTNRVYRRGTDLSRFPFDRISLSVG